MIDLRLCLLASLACLFVLVDSTEVNITVSNVPKILDLVERFNQPEATNATFFCSIGSGDLTGLTFEWRKDEAILNVSKNSSKFRITTAPENSHSVLRVLNLTSKDAGIYSCLAKNKFGHDRVSTRLSVKVQLKWVEQPPNELEVSVGKSLYIPCIADGSPKPTIEWAKIGNVANEFVGPELRLVSGRQTDAGVYECRAKNGADKDLIKRTELIVRGEYD